MSGEFVHRQASVGGVGLGPIHRRLSSATEATPLFLGDEQSGEGHDKPLCVPQPRLRRLRSARAE